MNHCLTAIDWKQALLQVVGEYIGTYKYQTGGNEFLDPAVAIGNPPNDIIVKGLEIHIGSSPRVVDQYQAGKETFTKVCWEIKLLQREEDSKGYVLPLAVERLRAYFHEAHGVYLKADNVLADYDQFLYSVYTYQMTSTLTKSQLDNLPGWSADF